MILRIATQPTVALALRKFSLYPTSHVSIPNCYLVRLFDDVLLTMLLRMLRYNGDPTSGTIYQYLDNMAGSYRVSFSYRFASIGGEGGSVGICSIVASYADNYVVGMSAQAGFIPSDWDGIGEDFVVPPESASGNFKLQASCETPNAQGCVCDVLVDDVFFTRDTEECLPTPEQPTPIPRV